MSWWRWSNVLYDSAPASILQPIQFATAPASRALVVDDDYVSVRLRSLRIVNTRKGITSFYGCVHSFIALLDQRAGGVSEFHVVSTADHLKQLDGASVHRVKVDDIPLLSNVPYRGDLHLELGLFSMKEDDLAKPYLDLLQSITNAAGVGILKTALSFASPVKTGIDLLVGAKAVELEVGIKTSPQTISAGAFVIFRPASKAVNFKAGTITVNDNGELEDGSRTVIDNCPYLIYTVEASSVRNDWFTIPDIKNAHDKMMDALRESRFTDVEKTYLPHFKLVCLTCPDLLDKHAQAIVGAEEKRVKDILGATRVARIERPGWSLEELNPF
jgi:hypothetical protein